MGVPNTPVLGHTANALSGSWDGGFLRLVVPFGGAP